jgi:hypothetical protein
MHAMLRKALTRLLRTHLNMPPQQELLAKNIAATWQYDITYSKLARLPLSELKNALKVPCPVADSASSENQIATFKRLRHYMTVEEGAVCLKCTRLCPFRAVPFKEMPVKPETTNKAALNDLLSFLISMSQQQEDTYSSLRWASAYKVVVALDPFLKDLPLISTEAFLFREVMKTLENEEKKRLKGKPRRKEEEAEAEEARKALAGRKIVL